MVASPVILRLYYIHIYIHTYRYVNLQNKDLAASTKSNSCNFYSLINLLSLYR